MITKLIQISDIKAIKPISDNIDVARLDPYIIEAQDLDIRPFLGDPLFYDLVEGVNASPQSTKYLELINGKSYTNSYGHTIYFDGLKVAIAYFAYARFMQNQGINVTRFGIVKKLNDTSEPIDQAAIDRFVGNTRSIGNSYIAQVEAFLDDDYRQTTRVYPLWREEEPKKPRSKFKITPVKNY